MFFFGPATGVPVVAKHSRGMHAEEFSHNNSTQMIHSPVTQHNHPPDPLHVCLPLVQSIMCSESSLLLNTFLQDPLAARTPPNIFPLLF
mmetsp:Transcript_42289/g.90844  ORF Transcript_42289/g.90844 Transcript_42289/m.90844 type:complete len:89 (+) Transcript_42289:127-393(+)